jgi:hypothetical protein
VKYLKNQVLGVDLGINHLAVKARSQESGVRSQESELEAAFE